MQSVAVRSRNTFRSLIINVDVHGSTNESKACSSRHCAGFLSSTTTTRRPIRNPNSNSKINVTTPNLSSANAHSSSCWVAASPLDTSNEFYVSVKSIVLNESTVRCCIIAYDSDSSLHIQWPISTTRRPNEGCKTDVGNGGIWFKLRSVEHGRCSSLVLVR